MNLTAETLSAQAVQLAPEDSLDEPDASMDALCVNHPCQIWPKQPLR